MVNQACDLWLLTEVSTLVDLAGFTIHRTLDQMQPGRHWAAVAARAPLTALPDPHPASAAARVSGLTVCSSVLPWPSAGPDEPWLGSTQAERTEAVVTEVAARLAEAASGPVVWGGDWNQAEPPGLHTVDHHVAVSRTLEVVAAEHHGAGLLSDHDLYVVQVVPVSRPVGETAGRVSAARVPVARAATTRATGSAAAAPGRS